MTYHIKISLFIKAFCAHTDKQALCGLMHRKYNFTLVATPVCSQLTLQASSSTWLEKLSTHNNNTAPWLHRHARRWCFYHFTLRAAVWKYTERYAIYIFVCKTVRLHNTIFDRLRSINSHNFSTYYNAVLRVIRMPYNEQVPFRKRDKNISQSNLIKFKSTVFLNLY